MAANTVVYVAIATEGRNAASIAELINKRSDEPSEGINALINLLARINGGGEKARVLVASDDGDGTAATFTITCTDANYTVGETLTIAGVVFTVVAAYNSDASLARNELVAGGSDAASGESLKDKINDHPLLKHLVTATDNDAGVVTCTVKDKGLHGNLIVVSETGDAFAVTQPSNGAEGTVRLALRAFSKGA